MKIQKIHLKSTGGMDFGIRHILAIHWSLQTKKIKCIKVDFGDGLIMIKDGNMFVSHNANIIGEIVSKPAHIAYECKHCGKPLMFTGTEWFCPDCTLE